MMDTHIGQEQSLSDDLDTARTAAETQHADDSDCLDGATAETEPDLSGVVVLPAATSCSAIESWIQSVHQALPENLSTPTDTTGATKQKCVTCMDDFPLLRLARTPCSHLYCEDCLSALFEASFADIGRFPPRCCGQKIPPSTVVDSSGVPLLKGDILDRCRRAYFRKRNQAEFYCSEPTCSAIIPHSRIHDDVATYPNCNSKTCTRCGSNAHEGQCSEDPAVQQPQQLARQEKWMQCVNCHRWMELRSGCDHISKWRAVHSDAHLGALPRGSYVSQLTL